MSSPRLKDGALFVHLRHLGEPTADECKWALFLHETDRAGGTLYQVETTQTGLVANHQHVEDIFHDPRERVEMRGIGYVPGRKFEHADVAIRSLDNGLGHLKEKTSLKWVLVMLSLLMEDKTIKPQSIKKLKGEMVEWFNKERSLINEDGTNGAGGSDEGHAGMGVNGEDRGKSQEGVNGEAESEARLEVLETIKAS